MIDETQLRTAVEQSIHKRIRVNMAHAYCLKTIFRIANEVDPRYGIMANDVMGRVYDNWEELIKADYIRERFYSLGGRAVENWNTGDILFFSLNHNPVDHAGLALNEREFVHLTKRGLRIDQVNKYKPVSAGRLA